MYTPAGMYERYYHNGQYASWKMIPRDLQVSPKYHFIISLVLMFVCLGLMLILAPYGMCYNAPLSAWMSACQFVGELRVSEGDNIMVSDNNCDTLYDKKDWQTPPKIVYPKAIRGRMYTVLAIDPDAPNHTNGTYYLHMIQANILGEDLKIGNFGKSLTIAPYVGPAPPKGSGDHRYMFVVYRHCKTVDKLPAMKTPERYLFDLAKWFDTLRIKLLGPEAGVQFKAHF